MGENKHHHFITLWFRKELDFLITVQLSSSLTLSLSKVVKARRSFCDGLAPKVPSHPLCKAFTSDVLRQQPHSHCSLSFFKKKNTNRLRECEGVIPPSGPTSHLSYMTFTADGICNTHQYTGVIRKRSES